MLLINIGCEKDDFGQGILVIANSLESTSLQVDVFDFSNLDGNLAIAVFNNTDDFNDGVNAYVDTVIPVNDFNMSFFIPNMDPGTYAVSVFHDADENGAITFGGFLNLIPQEGFGFSNNPSIGTSQPSYNDCSFPVEEGQAIQVPINLVYL